MPSHRPVLPQEVGKRFGGLGALFTVLHIRFCPSAGTVCGRGEGPAIWRGVCSADCMAGWIVRAGLAVDRRHVPPPTVCLDDNAPSSLKHRANPPANQPGGILVPGRTDAQEGKSLSNRGATRSFYGRHADAGYQTRRRLVTLR